MATFLNYPWPYFVSAGLVALMWLYVGVQRSGPRIRYFKWLLRLWFVWGVTAGVSTLIRSPQVFYYAWLVQFFISLLVASVCFLFALEYTGYEKWLARFSTHMILLPVLLFALTILVMRPNELVALTVVEGFPVIRAHEPLWVGAFTYFLAFWVASLVVLVGCMLKNPVYSLPILIIILGQSIPRIATSFIDPAVTPISISQVSIINANFTLLAYYVALFNFRLLQLNPVVRNTAIYSLPYGLIVLDEHNQLVDFNPGAQSLPGLPRKLMPRESAKRALGDWWQHLAPLISNQPASKEVVVPADGIEKHYELHSQPLFHTSGWRMGQMFILKDITQAREAQLRQEQDLWVQATQQEREQLAYDLHDGLSQSLGFLNLQAQAAHLQVDSGQYRSALVTLTRLIEVAGLLQEDTRELIANLISVSMPSENFMATLRQILDDFKQQNDMLVKLEVNGQTSVDRNAESSLSRVPPPVAVQLIRITQEALTNIRKHAACATMIIVGLNATEDKVVLSITDNGAGCDLAALQGNGHHFGLKIMNQRTERIGGQFNFHSQPGRGTRIEVLVPLAQTEVRSMA